MLMSAPDIRSYIYAFLRSNLRRFVQLLPTDRRLCSDDDDAVALLRGRILVPISLTLDDATPDLFADILESGVGTSVSFVDCRR